MKLVCIFYISAFLVEYVKLDHCLLTKMVKKQLWNVFPLKISPLAAFKCATLWTAEQLPFYLFHAHHTLEETFSGMALLLVYYYYVLNSYGII